jgi:hypothetical protein
LVEPAFVVGPDRYGLDVTGGTGWSTEAIDDGQ